MYFLLELLAEILFWGPYYFLGVRIFGRDFKDHPEWTSPWKRYTLGLACAAFSLAILAFGLVFFSQGRLNSLWPKSP